MILYFEGCDKTPVKFLQNNRKIPVPSTLEGIVSDVCYVKEIWRCCAMTRLVATETSNQYLDKICGSIFSIHHRLFLWMPPVLSYFITHAVAHADGKHKQFRMAQTVEKLRYLSFFSETSLMQWFSSFGNWYDDPKMALYFFLP